MIAAMKVLIIDDKFSAYEEERGQFKDLDVDVVHCSGLDALEVEPLVADVDAVIVNLFPVRASLIKKMERCRIIARYGVGFDSVDVAAATEKGIWVANVPDYATEDVSDHAMALLLSCIRKVPLHDAGIRRGEWNLHKVQKSNRTKGKVLGIIGFGAIGSAVFRKSRGFEFDRVLAHDPYIDRSRLAAAGAVPAEFRELLRESDYVTLHVPLNDETRHMIDEKALSDMKPSSILINTSRGGVVDTAAMVRSLHSASIAYAGLDVFEEEPLPAGSPLFDLENVILTSHCGWYTEESVVEMKTKVGRNVAEVLAGRQPVYPVNKI